MKTYRPVVGESIQTIARKMVAIAKKSRRRIMVLLDPEGGNFGAIEIVVKPDDKPNAIVKFYKDEVHENNRRFEERLQRQFYGPKW